MANWQPGQTGAPSADILENERISEEIPEEWAEILRLWATKQRTCTHGHLYYELDNVGSWKCRQHALEYDEGEGLWPCCGKTNRLDRGCVRADHRPFAAPLTVDQTIVGVPPPISRLMGPRTGDMGNGTYLRFDRQTQNRIRSDPAHSTDKPIVFTKPSDENYNIVTAVFPYLVTLKIGPQLFYNTKKIFLWDGEQEFKTVTNVIPEYLDSRFIFQKTEDAVTLKLAEVRIVPVEVRDGIRGIQYRRSFASDKLTWTPVKEVKTL